MLTSVPLRCAQIIDNKIITFKGSAGGVIFYCIGSDTENEMILTAVLEVSAAARRE